MFISLIKLSSAFFLVNHTFDHLEGFIGVDGVPLPIKPNVKIQAPTIISHSKIVNPIHVDTRLNHKILWRHTKLTGSVSRRRSARFGLGGIQACGMTNFGGCHARGQVIDHINSGA
ncbi:MAG TPA: hypothetical protein EYQ66_02975 [Myxococcales bacterium]|nr:hypothetical protein [Myxococcales bacterium]